MLPQDLGERIAARGPEHQTAEIHIRIALMSRYGKPARSCSERGCCPCATQTEAEPLQGPRDNGSSIANYRARYSAVKRMLVPWDRDHPAIC